MIDIQDTQSDKLPIVLTDDYISFFEREEIGYLASASWQKVCCAFWQEMKLHVVPCDIEELKRYLRNKREQILSVFEVHDYYAFWKRCFDLSTHNFNIAKFVKTLVTLYDGKIDRAELNDFFAWYCLTKCIDNLLGNILEQEKRAHGGIVNFYYNEVGEIHFGYNGKCEETTDINEEEPLRNIIFKEKIFDTNDRLIRLSNCIASAIDMGDATIMYGKPQDFRINPEAQNEWYYIVKAIEESGVAKKIAVTQFIEQMQEWFPTLFPSESKEEWEKFKRRLSKSISEEKGLWKHGKMKEVIPLRDMWAKQRSLGMDAAKMERIYAIAHQGLLRNLDDLKQEIAKEKSR